MDHLPGIQEVYIPDVWIGGPQLARADPIAAGDPRECIAILNDVRAAVIDRSIIVGVTTGDYQSLTCIQVSAEAGVGGV